MKALRTITIFTATLLLTVIQVFAQMPPAKVVVTSFSEKVLSESAKMTGVLQFDRISGVSTEVSGLVESVSVKSGDRVKKGEILFTLNTDFTEKDIDLIKTDIERLKVKMEQTSKNLHRSKNLYKKNVVSESDYDDVFFTHKIQVKDLEKREIDLARMILKKEKSLIKAPFDGLILHKNVDEGDWVSQGSVLCSAGSLSDIYVKLPVGENIIKYVTGINTIDVTINALDRKVKGTFSGLLPVADEKTKNIFIKIDLPFVDGAIENMSATVDIPVTPKKKLKIISRDALVKFQGKDFIYAVKDGKASILPVNVVLYTGSDIGLDNSGYNNDMKIVVSGNERLRPDQPVVVTGEL